MEREVLISVDIETDGPIPGPYSMLSLGACDVDHPEKTFYRELKPISDEGDPDTVQWLKRYGLDRDALKKTGDDPAKVMREFDAWITETKGWDSTPIFVAFNATFDWMFVQWYFVMYLGKMPFGHSGLDVKAYYMAGLKKKFWMETRLDKIEKRFIPEEPHTHNALDDAIQQAALFRNIRAEVVE